MATERRVALPLAIIGLCALALVLVQLPTLLAGQYANPDEGYAAALAERLLAGGHLYIDAVSQRGPLLYYAYAVMGRLFGWDSIRVIRVASLVLGLASPAIAGYIARRFVSLRAAAFVFVVQAYLVVVGMHAVEAIALHAESLLVPFLLAGVHAGALAMRGAPGGPRLRRLAIAGALFGVALSFKQTAAVAPLALVTWSLCRGVTERAPRRTFVELAVLAASVVLVPSLLLLHAASEGALGALVYYCFTYNLTVHIATLSVGQRIHALFVHLAEEPLLFLSAAAAVGLFLADSYRAIRRRAFLRDFDLATYLGLHFVLALLVACAAPQLFEHYFFVVVPLLALYVATAVSLRLEELPALSGGALVAGPVGAVLLVLGVATEQQVYFRSRDGGAVAHGPTVQAVARYLTASTSPRDSIFVWGFSPWLYGYSHRRPATRFAFLTYPTGFVPWFWRDLEGEPARVVPGSMAALLADLAADPPERVVDAGSLLIARPLRAYAEPARWLRQHYCFDVRIGSYDIYAANHGAPCANEGFPEPAHPVDFFEAPFETPVPPLVDRGPSAELEDAGTDSRSSEEPRRLSGTAVSQ